MTRSNQTAVIDVGSNFLIVDEFYQAMPDQYRNECAVTAYRAYYHGEKANFATWKSEVPQWWTAA